MQKTTSASDVMLRKFIILHLFGEVVRNIWTMVMMYGLFS